jgi:hypothetical protein
MATSRLAAGRRGSRRRCRPACRRRSTSRRRDADAKAQSAIVVAPPGARFLAGTLPRPFSTGSRKLSHQGPAEDPRSPPGYTDPVATEPNHVRHPCLGSLHHDPPHISDSSVSGPEAMALSLAAHDTACALMCAAGDSVAELGCVHFSKMRSRAMMARPSTATSATGEYANQATSPPTFRPSAFGVNVVAAARPQACSGEVLRCAPALPRP